MELIEAAVERIMPAELCARVGETVCEAVRAQAHIELTAFHKQSEDRWTSVITMFALVMFIVLLGASPSRRSVAVEMLSTPAIWVVDAVGFLSMVVTWIFVSVLTAGV